MEEKRRKQHQTIRIGTRGSALAVWQTEYIVKLLPEYLFDIVKIKTKGDLLQKLTFDKIEGKGFFTKEIEEALLDKRIDVAVHSLKDLSIDMIPSLTIAAVPERADPHDVLLIRNSSFNKANSLGISRNAIIGTSSFRREAQLKNMIPDINVKPLRGNVPTRIKKLRNKEFDAIIIAKAGLDRLQVNTSGLYVKVLPIASFLPAPGQGALAVQIRKDDKQLYDIFSHIHDDSACRSVIAERSFLQCFGGGCHIPLGAHAVCQKKMLTLTGVITSHDGTRSIKHTLSGDDPQYLGESLAKYMKKKGADTFL